MRKILLSLIMLLFATNIAFAFRNEPSGFRNLNWGISVAEFKSEYPNAILSEQTNLEKLLNEVSYKVGAQNSTISNVKITGPIKYSFWENKLISVSIPISGADVSDTFVKTNKMLSALNVLYGDCTYSFEDGSIFDKSNLFFKHYAWEGYTTTIILIAGFYDKGEYDSYCDLNLYSTALNNERNYKERKNAENNLKQGW